MNLNEEINSTYLDYLSGKFIELDLRKKKGWTFLHFVEMVKSGWLDAETGRRNNHATHHRNT